MLGKFSFQVFQMYFHGLIFVLRPEHIVAVAYCPNFYVVNFRFWALRNENKTQRNFPDNNLRPYYSTYVARYKDNDVSEGLRGGYFL